MLTMVSAVNSSNETEKLAASLAKETENKDAALTTIAELEAHLDDEKEQSSNSIDKLELVIEELEAFISENEVDVLKEELDQLTSEKEKTEGRISKLEGDLEKQTKVMDEKDEEISALKEQIEEKNEEISELKNPPPPSTSKLGAGKWIAGEHIAPGRYTVSAESGSGNFIVFSSSGRLEVNEILGDGDWGVTDVTFTLSEEDEIEISGITVIFEEAD